MSILNDLLPFFILKDFFHARDEQEKFQVLSSVSNYQINIYLYIALHIWIFLLLFFTLVSIVWYTLWS